MPVDLLAGLRGIGRRLTAERPVTTYLPQYSHVLPDVIRNSGGSVTAMFAADGARFEDLDRGQIAAQHERLCSLHRTLNLQARLSIGVHLVRGEVNPSEHPLPHCARPFVADLEQGLRQRLITEGRLYENLLFISIVIRPRTLIGRAKRQVAQSVVPVDPDDLRVLQQVMSTIQADIGKDYGLRRLGLREVAGRLFSEIAEAHSAILTGRIEPVPLPNGRLANAICSHRPVIRNDRVVELRHCGKPVYAALSGLSVYSAQTFPAMFDDFLSAPYRCVLSQVLTEMPLHDAQALVTRTSNRFVSANDPAATQMEELSQAADDLQQRAYGMGLHSLTLMVLADSEAALETVADVADSHLRRSGSLISRIDWDLEAAYFGLVPGTEGLHPRAAPWKTRNFAAAAPLRGFPRGWRNGKWCDYGAMLVTNGGTPYYWNPHTAENGGPGDVPHTLITGPNGSGKTTIICVLLALLMERARIRVVLWDKDLGAKLFVLRMGGAYIQIDVGVNTGLAPLKALSVHNPSDMDYLNHLIRALILSDEGPPLTADDEHRISLGLRTVMSMPVALRSLSEVRAFLGAAPGGLGDRLQRWCASGRLGWVLDNPADRLRFDAQIVGFDQTKYLDHKEACGPIQSYLFHRTGAYVGQGPMVVVIDEFQKSLQNPAFVGLIDNALATFRKLDCATWLATQSAATARTAPIAATIREQCLNQMHFPNGGAKWADFGPGGLGLTERAFEWVTTGLSGGGKGRFLLKQGTSYVPVQLSLEGMSDVIAVVSAVSETTDLLDEITKAMPDEDTDAVFAEFHRRRKMPAFQAKVRQAWQAKREIA